MNASALEKVCKEIGIPSGRIGLVKRNVELKALLAIRGQALTGWGQAWHAGMAHSGAYEECSQPACFGTREILRRTEP
jgi:hypothetical protein